MSKQTPIPLNTAGDYIFAAPQARASKAVTPVKHGRAKKPAATEALSSHLYLG